MLALLLAAQLSASVTVKLAASQFVTLGANAVVGAALVSTHTVTIKDAAGTTYRLMALV